MDLDALAASTRTALAHYERTRGISLRKRQAAAHVLVHEIRRAADQLTEADLDAAKAQAARIIHLKRELRSEQDLAGELGEQLTGARNQLAEVSAELEQARAEVIKLEAATLPQRRSTLKLDGPVWQKPPPVPTPAPGEAPEGPRTAAKPRTARSAGKETPKRERGSQSREADGAA